MLNQINKLKHFVSQIEVFIGKNTIMKTWQWLGYLGLLPFVLSLVVSLLVQEWLDRAKQIFVFYGAIILSFLAGSLWQVTAQKNNHHRQIISNGFALIAFAALLTPTLISIVVVAIGFMLIFYYENFKVKNSDGKTAYLKLRFNLTSIVVLLHVFALYFWTEL
jgi:hypothetical protein